MQIIISHHTLVLLSLTLVAVKVLIEVDFGEGVDLVRVLLMHSSLAKITRIAHVLSQVGPRIYHLELLWIADHLVVLDVWHNTIG